MIRALRYLLIVSLAFLCVTCIRTQADPDRTRVAAVLKTSQNPFFQLMWEGIKNEAMNSGVEVDLFWPEKESDFQYQYDVLATKVDDYDAVILSPSDITHTGEYLPRLKRKGIIVVVLDILPRIPETSKREDYYDVFAGTDNRLGGRLAAEYAHKHVGDIKKITIIGGFREHVLKRDRIAAFIESAKILFPGAAIQIYTADYDRDKARRLAREKGAAIFNSDLVYCANDHMALGVLDVMDEMGLKRRPRVIGYDSIREAQQMILNGSLDASVIQYPALMGREAVRAIVSITEGKYVADRILIPPRLSVKKTMIGTVGIDELDEYAIRQ
jgi:ribose transport system substrate-binding protein